MTFIFGINPAPAGQSAGAIAQTAARAAAIAPPSFDERLGKLWTEHSDFLSSWVKNK